MGDPRIDEAIAAGDVPSDVPIHLLRESRDTSAIAGIVVVLVLTTLVVVLRLYSRKYITKKGALGIDDGIALASLVSYPSDSRCSASAANTSCLSSPLKARLYSLYSAMHRTSCARRRTKLPL